MKRLLIALLGLATVSQAAAPESEGLARVSRHLGIFNAPPRGVPTNGMPDGPLLGNGDVGVVLAGPPEAQAPTSRAGCRWACSSRAPACR